MRARVVALAIAAVGTAIAIIAWLQPDRTGRTASDPAPPKRTLSASPVPVERAEPPDANAAAGTSALSEQAEAQLQTAHGEIHIERGGGSADRIDVNPRYGLGVWLPRSRRLRIVLTEHQLSAAETADLVGALSSGRGSQLHDAHAVLEISFVPTAQAFDDTELDSAVLDVVSAAGARATVDVLATLDWTGNLPPPLSEGSAAAPVQIKLAAAGDSAPEDPWQRSWRFDVEIPVVLGD